MGWTVMRGSIAPIAGALICVAAACAVDTNGEDVGASADSLIDPVALREQCATRLAIAFTGVSAAPTLFSSPDPQAGVNALLGDARFIERFSRFMNSRLNPDPGDNAGEDASYFLTKHIVQNNRPYAELFTGAYGVDAMGAVTTDANGLGYFRTRSWMVRYAGNEQAGYRLVSAYRILQNTTGLRLSATTNVVGVDLSTTGRTALACRGCHYDGWFALDKVARVLSMRKGTGATMTFTAPTAGPQIILDNRTISNDRELVTALVASDHFKFNACRHAFNFLYGRDESTADAAVFDKCVDALTSQGTMQAALSAVAKDPSFCQ